VTQFVLVGASRNRRGDVEQYLVGRVSLPTLDPRVDVWTRLSEDSVIGLLDQGNEVYVRRSPHAGNTTGMDQVLVLAFGLERLLVSKDHNDRLTSALFELPEASSIQP
jgi:hypothetical protein